MCFFPFKNNQINSPAYKKGVREFKCGACPECLAEKSRYWALRCSMQAMEQVCCMVTLTYDTYIHDTRTGRVIGERVSDLKVCKSDAQKFIKRVREYFARVKGVHDIKYLITAEYGKRTNRAHYHAILFGVEFDDLVRYKKSKRGNWINKSATLDKLWSHGICTVDTVCVNAKIARYCTKYCAKDSRADDTFMLYSRGIGAKKLLELFNGKSYVIDGREYPIPRSVWRDYIEKKYNIVGFSKYVPFEKREKQLRNRCEKLKKQYIKNLDTIKTLDAVAVDNFRKFREYYPVKKPLSRCSSARQYRVHYYQWSHYDALRKALLYAEENRRINAVHNSIYNEVQPRANRLYKRFTNERDVFNAIHLFAGADFCRFSSSCANSSDIGELCERVRSRYAYKKSLFLHYRDNDTLYKRYLKYWQNKAALIELGRADVRTRILQLPNTKYFAYKNAALNALNRRNVFEKAGLDSDCAVIPPRSNCISRYMRFKAEEEARICAVLCMSRRVLPISPCYKSANDRHEKIKSIKRRLLVSAPRPLLAGEPWSNGQISIFD